MSNGNGEIKVWSPDMELVPQEGSSNKPHLTTKTEGDNCKVSLVSSPRHKKSKTVRLYVAPPQNQYSRNRAVTRPNIFRPSDNNKAHENGPAVWFGVLMQVPQKWRSTWNSMVMEDHGLSGKKVGGKAAEHNPFSLFIKEGQWEAVHFKDAGYKIAKRERLGSIEPDKARWVAWLMHVKAHKNNGYVELYKGYTDGSPKLVYKYEGETFWGIVPLYFEAGQYNNDVQQPRTLYHANYVFAIDKGKGLSAEEVHHALVS